MNLSNQNIAKLLKSIATALILKKENLFKIRAYENAASAIEHSTAEVKDLWDEGKLDQIPGVGKNIQEHLTELFKRGEVKHFEDLKKGIDPVVFDLINISGIGPKTALELANFGIKSLDDLKTKLENGELVKLGFSEKLASKISSSLDEFSKKGDRLLLPYASAQADRILEYLNKNKSIISANPLGSLRRQVATVGDLDFAASSSEPKKVIEYFVKMPGVSRVVDQGENSATVILDSNLQVDLLVGKPESFGALLQHFTGSKQHNIHLRSFAERKGLSLSEYGVKRVKSGQIIATKTEEELYRILGMDTPAPEIREDTGEIEAALNKKIPKLVEFKDIKGDLHLHSNFPIEPSHDAGANSIEEIVKKAQQLGYKYIGVSDHSPAMSTHSEEQIASLIEKRTKLIQKIRQSNKSIHILNGLEIDILGDGSLSVPDQVLATLDYTVAGVHSGHRGSKEVLTKRILKALMSPYVDILAHPTGRLLNERESYDADWEAIFKLAAEKKKLLEINGFYNRLDLRDDLVRQAKNFGVKFIINTDSHQIDQMDNMRYGVSVARRGWAEAEEIINTWDWKDLAKWFNI